MVAMNRWGGEEKGNLITSLVAVGSLACGNNASGTKGSLCSASGRHIARNTLAVMVIQVFWGTSDICQVPVWERARTPGQAVLLSCGMEQALSPWPSLIPRVLRVVLQSRLRRVLMAQHTCSLEPGSLSMHPAPWNWPVLFVQLGEPHRVVTAVCLLTGWLTGF